MIFQKLGSYDATICGKNISRLLKDLLDSGICAADLKTSGEKLNFKVLYNDVKAVKKLCRKYDCNLSLENKKGIIVYSGKYGRHYGIYIGLIFAIMLLSFFSNHILQIKIVGGDKHTREAVYAVLEDYDIGFGCLIPSINFYELETALMLETDCIAWAGIRSHGSTLVINISEIKPTPPMTQKRMPANIVSEKDAVITDVQVYSGSLNVMIGDAVAKGQILISGEYTGTDGRFNYRYSQADVYGTYAESITFTQSFTAIEKKVTKNVSKSASLCLFDAQIPIGDTPEKSQLIENSSTTYFSFLGLELPIGITHTTYDEYEYIEYVQTEEQAREALYDDISRYEQNFLSDTKILSKKINVKKHENGLSAIVSYVLNGEIGKTQVFLPEKD